VLPRTQYEQRRNHGKGLACEVLVRGAISSVGWSIFLFFAARDVLSIFSLLCAAVYEFSRGFRAD
jgi:hypothetical protein